MSRPAGQILRDGYSIYGWRQVPVDISVIGEKANATRPEIEQIMICNTLGKPDKDFENLENDYQSSSSRVGTVVWAIIGLLVAGRGAGATGRAKDAHSAQARFPPRLAEGDPPRPDLGRGAARECRRHN